MVYQEHPRPGLVICAYTVPPQALAVLTIPKPLLPLGLPPRYCRRTDGCPLGKKRLELSCRTNPQSRFVHPARFQP